MSYGLTIKNDDSKIIIDEKYSNYVLYEYGTATLIYDDSAGDYLTGAVSFTSATALPPLIAIKPRSDWHIGLLRYVKSGNNYTGFILGGVGVARTNMSVSVMALIPVSGYESSEQFGLKVKDASGNTVFDSGRKSLIILDIDTSNLTYALRPDQPNEENIAHPSGTHYFISSPWGMIAQGYYDGANFTHWGHRIVGFKYVNSTTVSFGEVPFWNRTIPDDISDNLPYGYWPSPWKIITVKDII